MHTPTRTHTHKVHSWFPRHFSSTLLHYLPLCVRFYPRLILLEPFVMTLILPSSLPNASKLQTHILKALYCCCWGKKKKKLSVQKALSCQSICLFFLSRQNLISHLCLKALFSLGFFTVEHLPCCTKDYWWKTSPPLIQQTCVLANPLLVSRLSKQTGTFSVSYQRWWLHIISI